MRRDFIWAATGFRRLLFFRHPLSACGVAAAGDRASTSCTSSSVASATPLTGATSACATWRSHRQPPRATRSKCSPHHTHTQTHKDLSLERAALQRDQNRAKDMVKAQSHLCGALPPSYTKARFHHIGLSSPPNALSAHLPPRLSSSDECTRSRSLFHAHILCLYIHMLSIPN